MFYGGYVVVRFSGRELCVETVGVYLPCADHRAWFITPTCWCLLGAGFVPCAACLRSACSMWITIAMFYTDTQTVDTPNQPPYATSAGYPSEADKRTIASISRSLLPFDRYDRDICTVECPKMRMMSASSTFARYIMSIAV